MAFDKGFIALAVASLAMSATSAVAKELVLYNASDSVNTALVTAFKAKHPDIEVKFVSGSTGPIVERAIAEKANPQADVVYLVNNIALEQLVDAGVFEPYEPKNSLIGEQFRHPDHFYNKHFATTMCMIVNTERLAEKKLPMPAAWEDLIKPVYDNEISLPSPLKSGTGGAILTTFVDAFGWPFVENLNENVFRYSDGGSGGADLAASGEVTIGLSFDTTCFERKSSGRPVEVVYGRITPNVTEGGGLVAGAPHPEEARLFLDFMAGKDAAEVLGKVVGATAVPGYGLVDLNTITLWNMRRPVNIDEFRAEFTARILKQ
ncbi:iron(III) transport system substrate-binding protein [Pseudochelatococcus lubricantis]|uniref:Iron(III) transport system substrate-binding protein n=1 Tax=Pseudochelatococcus lubricantis TaxID=1538102 RepID=A0ABX0UYC4_9HYPH|nr:extracellular solute-binding protein [Pseudochelatococcus lubricantis]NIJ57931.1 iron(III) transport system substrate-binding protein [Pseudochelatococcus lubricantis]